MSERHSPSSASEHSKARAMAEMDAYMREYEQTQPPIPEDPDVTIPESEIREILHALKMATELSVKTLEAADPQKPKSKYVHENYGIKMETALLSISRTLHKCWADLCCLPSDFWENVAADPEVIDQIPIWVEPSRITIRIPYLVHRYVGNQDPFSHILAARLRQTVGFPCWTRWHAAFIHIYPSSTTQTIDPSNYDYRKVIDALAFTMNTNDDSRHFSYEVSSIFTDDYAPGCYIELTQKSSENQRFPTPAALL